MFKNFRKLIESKRGSQNWFWRFLVWLKDLIWDFSVLAKEKIKKWQFEITLASALKTPPFSCQVKAKTEIHSLISHKHLAMYILAIKSFLRFYNNLSVVVHDDGTFTAKDKKLLEKHLPGVRIIGKKEADEEIEKLLKPFFYCQAYRRNHLIAKQLFDYSLLSNTEKIISLDSDTLFLNKPIELIEWLKADKQQIICSYEKDPYRQKAVLADIGFKYQPDICVGLMAFYQDILDLDLAEKIIGKMEKLDWWTTQNIYPVLIKNKSSQYQIVFFNPSQYQNLANFQVGNTIFRHYWCSQGISFQQINDSKKIINELKCN